ncbi:hypothetical protein ABTY59_31835 [Streptomyces sp. NPDC096079]|uniref:hypothetical protein n=1 Tax=Streptomyces sp. NPDC096079 TaxID=3155820 RepID=UPI0033265D80
MTTSTTTRPRLSDRAHRIHFQLRVNHTEGEWVEVAALCAGLDLTSHEVRSALAELVSAGVVERERSYIRREGHPTHRTSFCLADYTSEVSA